MLRSSAKWRCRNGTATIAQASVARGRSSDRRAPCDLGRAEPGLDRVLLAHIGTLLGGAVASAAAGVIDPGPRIDPDDGVSRATRLRHGFGRELSGRRQ